MEREPEIQSPETSKSDQEHQKNIEELKSIEASTERREKVKRLQSERGNMLINILTSEVVSNGLDFVPFAGAGKMLVESIGGRTLGGEDLTPKERIIHAGVGAGTLALDIVGVGELEKGAILVGRSIGAVEKAGVKLAEKGFARGAEIFAKTAAFMAKHPKITEQAEEYADKKIVDFLKEHRDYREDRTNKEAA